MLQKNRPTLLLYHPPPPTTSPRRSWSTYTETSGGGDDGVVCQCTAHCTQHHHHLAVHKTQATGCDLSLTSFASARYTWLEMFAFSQLKRATANFAQLASCQNRDLSIIHDNYHLILLMFMMVKEYHTYDRS